MNFLHITAVPICKYYISYQLQVDRERLGFFFFLHILLCARLGPYVGMNRNCEAIAESGGSVPGN